MQALDTILSRTPYPFGKVSLATMGCPRHREDTG